MSVGRSVLRNRAASNMHMIGSGDLKLMIAQMKKIVVWLAAWWLSFACAVLIVALGFLVPTMLTDGMGLVDLRGIWRFCVSIGKLTIVPVALTSLIVDIFAKRNLIWPYPLAGLITGFVLIQYFFKFGLPNSDPSIFLIFCVLGSVGGLVFGLLRFSITKHLARS